jgi:F-type H+-transporting ATPase subunit epsilon
MAESNVTETTKSLLLEIVSPEGEIYKDRVDEVTLETAEGQITVLPSHAPLFSRLTEGEIVIKQGRDTAFVCVTGGFLEVLDNKVSVLANYAIRSEEIEEQRAEEARKKAEAVLKSRQSKRDFIAAERDLQKHILQLKVAEKYKKRRSASK